MFGLEELYKIGMLKVRKRPFGHVKRKCRIVCSENTSLLYLTAASFLKLFHELEMRKCEPYLEQINLPEIQRTVRLAWASKKSQGTKVVQLANELAGSTAVRKKPMAKWQQKGQISSKELKNQLLRIRVMKT